MIQQVFVLIILLILSGFFSSAETALFSISRSKARYLSKQKGSKANELIYRMKNDPHRLLSTILIGNNVVNIGPRRGNAGEVRRRYQACFLQDASDGRMRALTG